jgi:DNA replication and repair protein RecF
MLIKNIQISNFRNFKRKKFKFSPKLTVIVGPNASGKTNILEGLYLLSTGKSYRARVEEEMISHREEISRIGGRISADGEKTDLEIVLTRGEITVGEEPDEKKERAPRKKLLINGVSRRLFNFAANFRVVLFGPWDLDLVTESPSIRRKFLDFVLSQVDREYRRAVLSYEKGLRQRNKLLYRIREEALPAGRQGLPRSQLIFWNRLLVKNGDYIGQKRAEFIDFVNSTEDFPAFAEASAGKHRQDFSLDYNKSAISEARLEHYREEEVAAATTLVGPHRDDFCFFLRKGKKKTSLPAGRDLARYGSRGEQRMGVLWLKLAELSYIEKVTSDMPTLLLDDIFSELDHEHREIVREAIKGQQTIVTTADPHFIEDFEKVEKIELRV